MAERLTLEAMRYAHAVAETGSFSAAARAYGVTQPTLSNGVSKLEQRLGGALFERSPQGVTATALGMRIVPLLQRVLTEVDGVIAEARRLTEPNSYPNIHVGVSPLISPDLVARTFTAVRELPTVHDLVLREANMGELREGLLAGELDVILIPSVEPLPRFEHRIIDSEPVVVVDSSSVSAAPVELSDTSDRQFILVPDSCGLTKFTSQLFDSAGLPWHAYPGEASSYRVLEQWASLGLGAAMLPQSKVSSAEVAHRKLMEEDHEVELFYEAVWDPASAMAADLAAFATSITRV